MKNEILYNKTVQILVDAYMNDTLVKGNCTACAIGNILGSNMGIAIPVFNSADPKRPANICQISDLSSLVTRRSFTWDANKKLKDITGYDFNEFSFIEKSFENNTKIHWLRYADCTQLQILQDQFNGLMAVVDALDIIHENTDKITTVSTKKRFAKV